MAAEKSKIAPTLQAPPGGHPRLKSPGIQRADAMRGGTIWIDPGTAHIYPVSFRAYRRAREAEEKPLARHRALGPDIDHYVWRRDQALAPDSEVCLVLKPSTSPRIRRIISEILGAIGRGDPAAKAIRLVARRFDLRPMRARALIMACLGFEVRFP
jgi:hypothetical protein